MSSIPPTIIDHPFLFSVLCGILMIGVVVGWNDYQYKRKYKLPPGPKGIPFFGNMFQMPTRKQGTWTQVMAKEYGEMFTVQVASRTTVFLNTSRVVNDLLEKRSAIYSSRPSLPYTSDTLSGGCRMVLQPYGPTWRLIRKIMHQILNIKNAPTFAPFQDIESRQLVYDYLVNPEKWYHHNQRYANSVVMSVVFGKRMKEGDENARDMFETAEEFIAALQPGQFLVDTFDILKYLPKPLQWWRAEGQRGHKRLLKVYTKEVDDLKKRIAAGKCPPCFATKFLEDPETEKLGYKQTLFVLGSLMEAGSDTSRITTSQVVAAAATDSRWVKTVQTEMDRVCGDWRKGEELRLPGFGDRKNLKYMSAVCKEGFRWRPLAQIGTPHTLIKDDVYEGYHFPANTTFMLSTWQIALDPNENKDPLRFWPERWLDPSIQGNDGSKVEDPLYGHWGFGATRRVCTGYHVGDTNVWIVIARMLYCFDIEEAEPIDTIRMNVNTLDEPFKIRITPRSEKHVELINKVGKAAVGVEY